MANAGMMGCPGVWCPFQAFSRKEAFLAVCSPRHDVTRQLKRCCGRGSHVWVHIEDRVGCGQMRADDVRHGRGSLKQVQGIQPTRLCNALMLEVLDLQSGRRSCHDMP